MINWYQDFKIEIKLIHKLKDNDGNFLHESSRSIDTAFEYFIFFNLMDYMSRLEECQVYDIIWNEIDNDTAEHRFNFDYKEKTHENFREFTDKIMSKISELSEECEEYWNSRKLTNRLKDWKDKTRKRIASWRE